jgi:mannose/fructose/N-acetylgalactosamine-specific phosphotransferase system component IID
MICHSMFADLKGMFRYEAYILTGFSMALIPKLKGLFENFRTYIKRINHFRICLGKYFFVGI